jgi:YihY family inner membrane protein
MTLPALLAPLRRFDRYQQRHRWPAIPIAVVKKFSDDGGGGLAALLAYYAFFSLFPLLLVFVTVLGFVLHGDRSAQESIRNSVLAQFPVIGADLRRIGSLQGHALTLAIGIAGALWAGLGITQAAQNAFDRVWAVPFKERPSFARRRLRGLVLLGVLGTLFLASSLASGLVTGGLGGPLLKVAGIAVSLVIDVVLFAASFRLLTAAAVSTRRLLPGVLIASVLWEILQILGGYFVGHVIRHAHSTYGLFAFVIGLLAWLHLGAVTTLYGAEVNVVLARKLWPRSLFGPDVPADEKTLEALAKVEERSDRERVDVRFGERPR